MLLGSGKYLNAEDFISKIFKILIGVGTVVASSRFQDTQVCFSIFPTLAGDGNGPLWTPRPESQMIFTEHLFCVWHCSGPFFALSLRLSPAFETEKLGFKS